MNRHMLAGITLAVLAALTVLLSGLLGAEVQGVALLGAALGGALGLVPDRTATERVGAFATGFVVAWIGYVLRAAVLPDAPTGRAVAVLVVVLVCVAVSAVARGRLPLWAALIGAAAMAGAYESAYAADPAAFLATSPISATAVLIAAAVGFLATSLLSPTVAQDRVDELPPEPPVDDETRRDRPSRVAEPAAYRPFEPAQEA